MDFSSYAESKKHYLKKTRIIEYASYITTSVRKILLPTIVIWSTCTDKFPLS